MGCLAREEHSTFDAMTDAMPHNRPVYFATFDDASRDDFYPFSWLPLGRLLLGGRALRDQWREALAWDSELELNSRLVPDAALCEAIAGLQAGERLVTEREGEAEAVVLARRSGLDIGEASNEVRYEGEPIIIASAYDLVDHAGREIARDLEGTVRSWQATNLAERRAEVLEQCVVIGDASKIYVAPGARVLASTLNTEGGPIVLGRDTLIMEGSHVRGPFTLAEGSQLKMGTRIYGPTVVGPACRVGGEVSNSVFLGYANKGHDGFLGNSVIGTWCNLGAGTEVSNLKNNYGSVRVWSETESKEVDTGRTFRGLLFGDHSKSGIGTTFNTGTVVGVGTNVFGAGFPPKHLPPFTWGHSQGWYGKAAFFETAHRVMERRQCTMTDEERDALERLHPESDKVADNVSDTDSASDGNGGNVTAERRGTSLD
jgi:UDP-N-acetylglucosamine diphosphorylase/glucosamine-1-phosphate N-acetyltransferase